jgi:hypothetical protein
MYDEATCDGYGEGHEQNKVEDENDLAGRLMKSGCLMFGKMLAVTPSCIAEAPADRVNVNHMKVKLWNLFL